MKRILPTLLFSLSSVAMAVEQSHLEYRQGNFDKAYEKLAKQKSNKVSLYYLGQMTLKGYGTGHNTTKGIGYIKESASRGYLPAQLFLAQYQLMKNHPDKAFKWYKWAANTGNLKASLYVASAYLHGYGVKKNPDRARKFLVYAAKKGNPVAQAQLAENFLKSRRYRSQKLGRIWLSKALKQGNSHAMVIKAKQYLNGRSLLDNEEKAEQLLKQAAQKGNVHAYYQLGRLSEKSSQFDGYDKAYQWYQKGIAAGDSWSMYRLGFLKLSTEPQQAVKLLTQAAKLGNRSAMKVLAQAYAKGEHVEKNKALAKKWRIKSKNRYLSSGFKNPKQATFAWLGDGDIKAAQAKYALSDDHLKWHNKQSLKKGIVNAAPIMPKIHKSQVFSPKFVITEADEINFYDVMNTISREGVKVTRWSKDFPHYNLDPKHSDLTLFEWQAHHGDSISQFKLGLAYQYGIGVKKDPMLARQWYIKAVKQKNVRAEYQLGLMYLIGDGVGQNFEKAMYWMNKSAFKGNAMSQFVLAVLYDNGHTSENGMHTIAPDHEVAVNMYNLAASEGVAKAQLKLAQLYSKMLATNNYPVAKQKKMHAEIYEMYYFAYKNGMKQAALPLAYYIAAKSKDNKELKWAYDTAEKMANEGRADAALLLGLLYDRGIGIDKDSGRAVSWYQKAMEKNSAVAAFLLGTHYYTGNGVSKNVNRSVELLTQASNAGLAYADYNLGIIQQHQGKDFISRLTKAAKAHYAPAELALADYYLAQDNQSTELNSAADSYMRLAKLGYAKAQLKLAYLYQHGISLPKNNQQAGFWYLQSARQGNAIAQFQLAKMYQFGTYKKQNLAKANYWYDKSAKQDFKPALAALGFYNEMFARNYQAAETWYYKAAQLGNVAAQYDLALMYLQGKGVAVEGSSAAKWLEKAALGGNDKAQVLIGLMALNGKYLSKSPEQAYQWFVKAAQANNKQAYYQLGLLYETGVGTKLDEKRAMTHYQQAAALGSDKAKYAMGRLYDYGVGVNQDKTKAVDFYQQASNNNVAAQYRLAMLYLDGNGVDRNTDKAKALFKRAASNGSYRALDYYNYLIRFKGKDSDNQLTSYIEAVPLNYSIIERESSPNLLYLDAITDLNQGELVQSRKMLNQIMWRYPDFNPAKTVLKNI